MKTSVLIIKQTGITCAENLISVITLLAINAIFIIPVVLMLLHRFSTTSE